MIVAVDFDGTLCENAYPEIGWPIWKVINYVKRLKRQGAVIILWTCRVGEDLDKAIAWCKEHNLTFDYINEQDKEHLESFGNTYTRKIYADLYIDDKAKSVSEVNEIYTYLN